MRVPVNTCAMPLPVRRKPWRSRSSQPRRSVGGASAAGSTVGGKGAASGAAGVGATFFLKKLNIGGNAGAVPRERKSEPRYTRGLRRFSSVG